MIIPTTRIMVHLKNYDYSCVNDDEVVIDVSYVAKHF